MLLLFREKNAVNNRGWPMISILLAPDLSAEGMMVAEVIVSNEGSFN